MGDLQQPWLHEHRRWRHIALLGGLEVMAPIHEHLGLDVDAAQLRRAALEVVKRRDLRIPHRRADTTPKQLMLEHADPSTRDALLAWEPTFVDLPMDDPHLHTWLSFFQRGYRQIPEDDVPEDLHEAVVAWLDTLVGGPVSNAFQAAKDSTLSRDDALLYALEGFDHDDPLCDDPLSRARYQANCHSLRQAAAEWHRTLHEEALEDMLDLAEHWYEQQPGQVDIELLPIPHIARPPHARHP